MSELRHLTEDELSQVMDREIAPNEALAAERHLFTCNQCSERLRRLTCASAAYQDFQDEVLEPLLDVSASEWRPSASGRTRPAKRLNGWMLLAVAACFCVVAFAVAYLLSYAEPSAQQVLTRAENADYRTTGTIVFATSQYRLARPAVLLTGTSDAHFEHIKALFVEARYSWDDPLNARSFATWRKTLHRRKDEVTSVVEPGGLKLYQVRTRTPDGILQAALITLKADTYQATRARFEFRGEESLELRQQAEIPPDNSTGKTNTTIEKQAGAEKVETAATPEEELRVFAALAAIGADAGDPIDVRLDTQRGSSLVTGVGLSSARRKEVENAVSGIAKVTVEFTVQPSVPKEARGEVAQTDSTGDNADMVFRQKLAVPFGGIPQLEAATNKALDSSNALFARAHWLKLMAREFPRDVETKLDAAGEMELANLRRTETDAMTLALRNLKDELTPLLAANSVEEQQVVVPNATWQARANMLFEDTRNLDALLSRLLAGSYTEEVGNNLLKQLPADFNKVESFVRLAVSGGK
jgi:hypothetical protein